AGRAVKRGQETIACRVHLAASEALELAANDLIMSLHQGTPCSIAECSGVLGGTHDVREENRRQRPVRARGRTGAGQELGTSSSMPSASPTRSSQRSSTLETKPGIHRRSKGPSPTTW